MSIAPVEIPVALCVPSPTARPISPIQVEILSRSIKEIGLRQPINVRALPTGDFEVRGGGHRVASFRDLGLDMIPAFVREDDDPRAEMAEIDENLCRNELSPAERAAAIARRKTLYEAIHGSAKAIGAAAANKVLGRGDASANLADAFTSATAVASGSSQRTIQREAARGEALGPVTLAKVTGTSLDRGEELDALAALSPQRRSEIVDRAAAGEKVSAKIEVKKERRADREQQLAGKQRALPVAKFGVIYADPEWKFETYSENGMDRSADNHYPTSDLDAILQRPVASIAAEDSVLFLWATVPMLPQGLQVMAAWGFTYKSHLIWNKNRAGNGYWFRNRHELLLVGTRGNLPAPAMGTQFDSVIDEPLAGHSEKPDAFYEVIERYFPTLPKIELNARRSRTGWMSWGLEAPVQSEQSNFGDGLGNHEPGSIMWGDREAVTAPSGRAVETAKCPAVTENLSVAPISGACCSRDEWPLGAVVPLPDDFRLGAPVPVSTQDAGQPARIDDDLAIPAFLRRRADNSLPSDEARHDAA